MYLFQKKSKFFLFSFFPIDFFSFFSLFFEKSWKISEKLKKDQFLNEYRRRKYELSVFFKKNKQVFFVEYTKRNYESLKKMRISTKLPIWANCSKLERISYFWTLWKMFLKILFCILFEKENIFFCKKMKRGTFFSKKSCIWFVSLAFWILFSKKGVCKFLPS